MFPLRALRIAAAFLFAIALGVFFAPEIHGESLTVFTHARLIDGNGQAPIENATVVVSGKRIVAAGQIDPAPYLSRSGVQIVTCTGKTIMPSLISDHSHLGIVKGGKISPANYTRANIEKALKQYEGYGVTAVLSLGMNRDLLYTLRDEQHAGALGGADIFTADRGLGAANGAPPPALGPDQISRPRTPDEARQMVREMTGRHPDMIKLWLDDMFGTQAKMPPEICLAIIDEAHRHHLRVAAHVFYLDDAKLLVRNGLDVVAHSIRDQPVDAEFLGLMKEHHTAYISTLALDESQFIYAFHPGWMDSAAFRTAADPKMLQKWLSPEYAAHVKASEYFPKNESAFANGLKNLKTVYDAGVLVGFGTDSGAMPTRLPGWAEHRELQLMVQAGLTPMQAIGCATKNAAIVIGDDKNRGTIEPGKLADFLILSANPLDDIRNTTHLYAIYHNGQRIAPAFHEPISAVRR
jgi:imidazolonepropionase-like amidohydrolase